jgi:hypothetical protein
MKVALSKSDRRAVALVITLIMLAVVTITAVAFLGVARRERSSVSAAGEQADSRLLADAALSRARAEILGRINRSGDLLAPGIFNSVNPPTPFYSPTLGTIAGQPLPNAEASAVLTNWLRRLTNVSYSLQGGGPQGRPFNLSDARDRENYLGMLANLYFDPRPPVFVRTNRVQTASSSAMDFRFFLDLNRNGQFDANGFQFPRAANGGFQPRQEFFLGDPEWIGILGDPDLPHSGNNRFVGRIAYLVVPADRTLDLNAVHNQARDPENVNASTFFRNQGAAPWEINLAAAFVGIHSNIWPASTHVYQTNLSQVNTGLAFDHALRIWRQRAPGYLLGAEAVPVALRDVVFNETRTLNGGGNNALAGQIFPLNGVDDLSDGPLVVGLDGVRNPRLIVDGPLASSRDNVTNKRYSGADPTNVFSSPFELFDLDRGNPLGLGSVLQNRGRPAGVGAVAAYRPAPLSTYDQYTFYRLLSSLGTDSSDSRFESGVDQAGRYYRRAKLNLNYRQANARGDRPADASVVIDTNATAVAAFVPWSAEEWMNLATDRLLRKGLVNAFKSSIGPGQFAGIVPEGTNGLAELHEFVGLQPRNPTSHGTAVAGVQSVSVPDGRGGQRQISVTHAYTAAHHRLAQVAANIYETRTNIPGGRNSEPFPPHVYMPILYRDDSVASAPVARIARYLELTNALTLLQPDWANWIDPTLNMARLGNDPRTVNNGPVVGMPMVIGVKQNGSQGVPTFNEAFWQNRIRVTRRLAVAKVSNPNLILSTNAPLLASGNGLAWDAEYFFEVDSTVAAEAWNAYQARFPTDRPLRLIATNWTEITVYNTGQAFLSNAVPLLVPIDRLAPLPPLVGQPRIQLQAGTGPSFRMGAGQPGDRASWDANEYVPVFNTRLTTGFVFDPTTPSQTYVRSTIGNLPAVRVPLPQSAAHRTAQNSREELTDTPNLSFAITNRLVFTIIDESFPSGGRILDFVNLRRGFVITNVCDHLRYSSSNGLPSRRPLVATLGGVAEMTMADLWDSRRHAGGFSFGMSNQVAVSVGRVPSQVVWPPNTINGFGSALNNEDAQAAVQFFLFGERGVTVRGVSLERLRGIVAQLTGGSARLQMPFAPTADVILTDRLQANDPLVHYTAEDLQPGAVLSTVPEGYALLFGPEDAPINLAAQGSSVDLFSVTNNQIAFTGSGGTFVRQEIRGNRLVSVPAGGNARVIKSISAASPWGVAQRLGLGAAPPAVGSSGVAFNIMLKDSLIRQAADWRFPNPSNSFASIGQLGRIHRGTPWQTLYMKSPIAPNEPGTFGSRFTGVAVDGEWPWAAWSGSYHTHPTNDWALFDLFTTANTESGARGQIAVNQAGLPAWSGLLSGVPVLRQTNGMRDPETVIVQPPSRANPQVTQIVDGWRDAARDINFAGVVGVGINLTNGVRSSTLLQASAEICAVDTLSVGSPFLQGRELFSANGAVADEVLESLPQQIMGLLKSDSPRYVVYAWAQTLRPAPDAVVTSPGRYFGMVTNYQVTGEFATKTLLRVEGAVGSAPTNRTSDLRFVVEDHRNLPAGN